MNFEAYHPGITPRPFHRDVTPERCRIHAPCSGIVDLTAADIQAILREMGYVGTMLLPLPAPKPARDPDAVPIGYPDELDTIHDCDAKTVVIRECDCPRFTGAGGDSEIELGDPVG